MTSATDLAELVTFERLRDQVTLADVFQDVPDDTAPPVVIVGDMEWDPFTDDPDEVDKRITLRIVTVTAGDERAPCLAIVDEVEAALRGYDVTRDGWRLRYLAPDSDAALIGDDSGYHGTTSIEIVALRQD